MSYTHRLTLGLSVILPSTDPESIWTQAHNQMWLDYGSLKNYCLVPQDAEVRAVQGSSCCLALNSMLRACTETALWIGGYLLSHLTAGAYSPGEGSTADMPLKRVTCPARTFSIYFSSRATQVSWGWHYFAQCLERLL